MSIPRLPASRLAPLALLLALAACDEERAPSAPPPGAVPGALRVSAGDGQAGIVGAELPSEITVEVVDAGGRPMPGVPVRFAVVAGGGQVAEAAGTSNGWGQVRTRWTLGTVAADSQVVEARVDALAPVRLRATVRPGAAASLAVTAGNGAAGPVGGALADSLAVTVKDRYGNPVAGLEVAWEAITGGGATSPARTATGADGTARTRWTLGPRVDSAQVALARVAGLDSVAFTANAVTTGVPLVLTKRGGDGQRGTAGGVLADSLGVLLRMADGRPVAGAIVSWSVPPAAGVVSPAVTRTDANGAASAAWRLGTSPGLVQATATVDSGTLIFTSLVQADAPAAMVAVAGGGEGPVGGALADSLAVRVTDRHGNPVPGAAVDWSAQTGGGAVQPARSTTDAQGIARAQWTLGPAAGAQSARGTVAGLPPVAFSAAAGTGGVPLQLAKRGGDGQRGPAGSLLADSLRVVLRLPDGRGVSGVPVRWSVPPGAGTVAPAESRTDANGTASAAWRLGTATGLAQATATVDEGTLTFTALVEADAPAAMVAVAGGGEGPVGGALADSLAVRVTDRHGNPVPGAEVAWSAQTGGGALSPARSTTDAQGVARARWTLGAVAGTPGQTASATLSGLPPVAFQATAVTRGVPLQLVRVSGDGQGAAVSTALADSLVVQLRTQAGQPVQGATVAWAAAAGSGSVSPAASRTDADGRASTRWTLGTQAGAMQASATVDEGALAFSATARAGAPHSIQASGGGGQSATRGTILPDSLAVRVMDAYGNGVPGTWVYWEVSTGGGGGRMEADSTLTGADGVARVRWALGLAAGANRAFARSAARTGALTFYADGNHGDLSFTRVSRSPIPSAGGSNTTTYFNELLVVQVTDEQGTPVVGAEIRWPPFASNRTRTGWDGRAEWRWSVTVGVGGSSEPIRLAADFEDRRVQWETVRLREADYEYTVYGIDFDRPSAVAGDTVYATATVGELYNRFPAEFSVDWSDDNGWSASTSREVHWPVGSKTGERTITACASPSVGGEGCASATIYVAPPGSAASRP